MLKTSRWAGEVIPSLYPPLVLRMVDDVVPLPDPYGDMANWGLPCSPAGFPREETPVLCSRNILRTFPLEKTMWKAKRTALFRLPT